MAMRKVNGRPSRAAQRTSPSDTQLVLARARQVTSTADALARLTDQGAGGAEEQTRALDRSLSSLDASGGARTEHGDGRFEPARQRLGAGHGRAVAAGERVDRVDGGGRRVGHAGQ